MSLTFSSRYKNNIPIALVKGGKYDSEVLYINPDKETTKKLKLKSDSKFEIIPQIKERFITYICGKSGSGKSTLAADIALKYHKMFPKNKIYLFSKVDQDDAFEKMEKQKIIKRFIIDKSLIDEPVDVLNSFINCLTIFDDVDTYTDNKIMKAIDNIRDEILQTGRHNNISMLVTSHHINNTGTGSKITRSIMNELHHLIFFNKSRNYHQIHYCLKKYFGMKTKEIDELLDKKDTRWTLISSNHPQYILTQNTVYLPE